MMLREVNPAGKTVAMVGSDLSTAVNTLSGTTFKMILFNGERPRLGHIAGSSCKYSRDGCQYVLPFSSGPEFWTPEMVCTIKAGCRGLESRARERLIATRGNMNSILLR